MWTTTQTFLYLTSHPFAALAMPLRQCNGPFPFNIGAFGRSFTFCSLDGNSFKRSTWSRANSLSESVSKLAEEKVSTSQDTFFYIFRIINIFQVIIYTVTRTNTEPDAFVILGISTLCDYKLAEHECAPFIVYSGSLRTRMLATTPSLNTRLDLSCLETAICDALDSAPIGELQVRTQSWRVPVSISLFHLLHVLIV